MSQFMSCNSPGKSRTASVHILGKKNHGNLEEKSKWIGNSVVVSRAGSGPVDDAKCGTVVPQQVDLFVQCGCGDTERGGLYGATAVTGARIGDSAPEKP